MSSVYPDTERMREKIISTLKPSMFKLAMAGFLFLLATQLSGGWTKIISPGLAGIRTQIGFPLQWALLDPTSTCVMEETLKGGSGCSNPSTKLVPSNLIINLIFWYLVSCISSELFSRWYN